MSNDFPASETAEHVASTPPPTMSNVPTMLPPRSEGRRNRSEAWDHFTPESGIEKKAKCNYCNAIIRFDNGTSGMRSHLLRCKHRPEQEVLKRQKSSSSVNVEDDVVSSPLITKFDQDEIRRAMVDYFVDCELPFRQVEQCLNEWGINRVLGVTVDNASSNDVMIQHLKKRFTSWNCLLLNGDFLHMRCCAHILNLIVKDGFKELDDSIIRIRNAVKFINDTPSRYAKFKACIDPSIEYKGYVGLDCETRWNSTYIMLDAALKHQKTFEELEMQDGKFVEELEKKKGVPSYDDWEYVRAIIPFLKVFYEATLTVSGSSYVTSSSYMYEVFGIRTTIRDMCGSSDPRIKSMAERMKEKYDKYWGELNNLNMLLMTALVLDPRHKMQFVNWYMNLNFAPTVANDFIKKVESSLESLFAEFNGGVMGSTATSADSQSLGGNRYNNFNLFYQTSGSSISESELSRYLSDPVEPPKELDVLNWWCMNSSRYPILAEVAREILAIPVSTVASESAFSTGGRVLDPYRCRLTPTTVEALICTQDWFGSHSPMLTEDDLRELENLEQELNDTRNVAATSSVSIALDDD